MSPRERGPEVHAFITRMLNEFLLKTPVHDPVCSGPWICECGYSNVGPHCTKCGCEIGAAIMIF